MSLTSELATWINSASLTGIASWDPSAGTGVLRYDRLPPDDRDAISIQVAAANNRNGIPGYLDVTFVILSQGDTETKHRTVMNQIQSRNKTESMFRPIDLTSYRIESMTVLSWVTKNGTTSDGGLVFRSSFTSKVKETA